MGLDLARKAQAAFNKALDRRAAELAAGTLFSRKGPVSVSRAAIADVVEGARVSAGDEIVVACVEGRIVGTKGIDEVVCFSEPDPDWCEPVREGVAALAGVVDVVHDLGGGCQLAEVRLCPL